VHLNTSVDNSALKEAMFSETKSSFPLRLSESQERQVSYHASVL